MPYTFIHPAFVAPLKHRWPRLFDTPALIMGSIAPDLDIIYRFTETRQHIFNYSMSNILMMILPIAVVMAIYIHWLMIPVYTSGKFSFRAVFTSDMLKKIPMIIFSAFIAILVHIGMDNVAHIDDIINKSVSQAEDIGREADDYHDIYFLMMYGPQLLASSIGGIILLIYGWIFKQQIWEWTTFLRNHYRRWSLILMLIGFTFTYLKLLTVGVESEMEIDSYLISITCGLLSAMLLSPAAYYLLTFYRSDKRVQN